MLAPEVAQRILTQLPGHLEEPAFTLVGVGGAGLNVLGHVTEGEALRKLAVDRDGYRLALCDCPDQVELGNPSKDGTWEALAEGGELDRRLEGDILLVTAGLGRTTGTRAAPAIAARGKARGLPVLAFLIWPFREERISGDAERGLTALRSTCDALMVLDNEAALDVQGTDGHWEAARLVNGMVARMVERLVERVSTAFPFSLQDEITDFMEGIPEANAESPLRAAQLRTVEALHPIPVDARGFIRLR